MLQITHMRNICPKCSINNTVDRIECRDERDSVSCLKGGPSDCLPVCPFVCFLHISESGRRTSTNLKVAVEDRHPGEHYRGIRPLPPAVNNGWGPQTRVY